MKFPRSSGILLHPTSLPGRFGLGSLGDEAYRFVDRLAKARQRYWQVLPLGPTGYGDSPYQSFSAFAGNPLLIDLERLQSEGLLTREDLLDAPAFPTEAVDYGWVIPYKLAKLRAAFERFEAEATSDHRRAFEAFQREQEAWLLDYARFMAFKDHFDGAAWSEWDLGVRSRRPEVMATYSERLAAAIRFYAFLQYLFFSQYLLLKEYAAKQGVGIIGDLPIFVALDSADAWSHPELYFLDETGHPTVVAGVPPDYFSETGQLWGNPLYRWDVFKETGFAWWIERLKKALTLYDVVRIDHFRGFEAYWEVPATEPTAINGRWVKGPDRDLFSAIERALGNLPIIAEDLGVITPAVEALRDQAGLPGMKILQFAFGAGAENAYLPHHFPRACVVYTGTHDNDTTRGWFEQATEAERAHVRAYAGCQVGEGTDHLIHLALGSVADLAVVPMQDWLDLGTQARMNVPGRAAGNWAWRMGPGDFDDLLVERIRMQTELYGREATGALNGALDGPGG